EVRAVQEELGKRIDCGGKIATPPPVQPSAPDTATFAKALGTRIVEIPEPRATHRRTKRSYKTRVRMPSKLDPHVTKIEGWLAAEPQLTAIAVLGRLAERFPGQFGKPQHSIVQRLLKSLRIADQGGRTADRAHRACC